MNDLPEKLREHLRNLDKDLADRADNFWRYATPILGRQSRPGSNENGRAHVEKVELTIWRLIKDSGKASYFTPLELFILSCAAVSHDFDKGLFDKLPEGVEHGKGSGDLLINKFREFQAGFPEMVVVKKIIGVHALSPEKFLQLSDIDRKTPLSTGPVRTRQLAVLLKAADILHTDNSRIAHIGIDTSAMDKFDLSKHQAREAISGWQVDGSRIVIQAIPRTIEHLRAVEGCIEFITNKEWPAVADKLADFDFPHELDFRIDKSICGEPERKVDNNSTDIPGLTSAAGFSRDNFVFTVPYRQKGDSVVGREDALQRLRKQLAESGGSAIGQTASFHGIGGLGKTQLAVEYAYRYKDSYPKGVLWIASDQEIDPQLVRIAKKGNWISPESEHKLILEIATRRLKTFSECLIIFDNVEQLEDIEPYLPEPEAEPHIILTSRTPQEGFPAIDLALLSPDLSRKLLLLESGRTANELASEENEAALAITEELGRLPLAIELAGAYLKNRRTLNFTEYLGLLQKNPLSALPTRFAGFTQHEADLYRTLQISKTIFEQEPLLEEILDLLTWSGSTFMGISLLARIMNREESDLWGPLSLGVDLRIFRKDKASNRYEIHRLLRAVRRHEFPIEERASWIETICERLAAWFTEKRENFSFLADYEAELDHLVEWQHHAENIGSIYACRLLWLQAYPPWHLGKYSRAFDLVRAALDDYRQGSFDDQLFEADILDDLGTCHGALGEHKKALEYKIRALEIREKALGPDHPDTAISLNNVGITYGALGDHEKALEYNSRALEIREKVLGPNQPETAISLNNVGVAYGELGKHKKALEYKARALKICEKAHELYHPHTASSLDSLGATYCALGEHEEAMEHAIIALKIREKVLGPDHPHTATSLNNVGTTYADLEDHEKALKYKIQALEIREKVLGPDHPDTATSLNSTLLNGLFAD